MHQGWKEDTKEKCFFPFQWSHIRIFSECDNIYANILSSQKKCIILVHIHTNTHRKWIILMGLLGNDVVGEGRGKRWWVGILLQSFYFFYEKGLAVSPLAWSWLWWRCFYTASWRYNWCTIRCIYINMHINVHLEHTTGKSSDICIQPWSPHYSQDK